jgi:sec-independent protein translocase protein TatA
MVGHGACLQFFFTLLTLIGGTQMFEGLFQPTHLVIIAGIALLIFGPKKLPELGKGLGEGLRGFKSAMKGEDATAPAATVSKTPLEKA